MRSLSNKNHQVVELFNAELSRKGNSTVLPKMFEECNLYNHISSRYFKKNDQIPRNLCKPGQFSIIKSGLVVEYFESNFGDITVVNFKTDGQLLRPISTANSNNNEALQAKCLKDSEIIFIDYDFIFYCPLQNIDVSDFYSGLIEDEINITFIQLALLKEASYRKRYLRFLETHKHIVNQVPDRMIANFLGIHYTTLSRIKSNI